MSVVEANYTVVLAIESDLERARLFQITWETLAESWSHLPARLEELSLFLDGSSTYLDLSGASSVAEVREKVLETWLQVGRDCTVFGLNLGNTVIPNLDSLGFTQMPPGGRWNYLVCLCFESTNCRDTEGFAVIQSWARALFERLSADVGIAANYYIVDRMLREASVSPSLNRLLTLTEDWKVRQAEIRKLVGAPERAGFEDFMNDYGEQFPWNDTYSPAWFYLLSPARLEASRPHLPDLPLEAAEQFPDMGDYAPPRLEELPSGGACVFFAEPVFLF